MNIAELTKVNNGKWETMKIDDKWCVVLKRHKYDTDLWVVAPVIAYSTADSIVRQHNKHRKKLKRD